MQREVVGREAVVQQPLPLEEAVVPGEVPHVEPAAAVPERGGGALVERFDIEPFPDFSAK